MRDIPIITKTATPFSGNAGAIAVSRFSSQDREQAGQLTVMVGGLRQQTIDRFRRYPQNP